MGRRYMLINLIWANLIRRSTDRPSTTNVSKVNSHKLTLTIEKDPQSSSHKPSKVCKPSLKKSMEAEIEQERTVTKQNNAAANVWRLKQQRFAAQVRAELEDQWYLSPQQTDLLVRHDAKEHSVL